MILAVTVGVLAAGGTYQLLQRSMVRAVFGIGLWGHAVNLMLLATGVPAWRGEPMDGATSFDRMADPLPQAFVLTAIVITMAVLVILLMLAVVGHDDDLTRVPRTGQRRDR